MAAEPLRSLTAPTTATAAAPRVGVVSDAAAPPGRGEQTRSLILDTALRLFEEQGYEKTTMRAIASDAGVSVGNAYYYFDSKEHLIQAFYGRNAEQHLSRARAELVGHTDLADRLSRVLRSWVDINVGVHDFAGSFFKSAADPKSPLSPFSAESGPARAASISLYAGVVEGSTAKVAPALADELPRLLWMYQMGIVLYWVHDSSPGTVKTYELIDRSVPLVVRLIKLSRYRVLRGALDDALGLVQSLSGGRTDDDSPAPGNADGTASR